jgi:hypothetical protein
MVTLDANVQLVVVIWIWTFLEKKLNVQLQRISNFEKNDRYVFFISQDQGFGSKSLQKNQCFKYPWK